MNFATLIPAAVGAGLVYAANKVSAVPGWARVPLAAVGAVMVVKSLPVKLPVISDNI